MPNYANAGINDYNSLVNLLKPIVNLMLPIVVKELGDDFYSKYSDATTVDTIASSVETSLNSLKAISSDVQTKLSEMANLVCNG